MVTDFIKPADLPNAGLLTNMSRAFVLLVGGDPTGVEQSGIHLLDAVLPVAAVDRL